MVKHNKVDGTKTKSRVGLIAMLATLVVAIVALVVGIVVVNLDGNRQGDVGELSSTTQMEIEREFQDVVMSGDLNSGIKYLNDILENGYTEGGAKLSERDVFATRLSLANLCIDALRYDESLKILDELEASELSEYDLGQVYSAYISLYNAIGDFDKLEEYITKFERIGGEQ